MIIKKILNVFATLLSLLALISAGKLSALTVDAYTDDLTESICLEDTFLVINFMVDEQYVDSSSRAIIQQTKTLFDLADTLPDAYNNVLSVYCLNQPHHVLMPMDVDTLIRYQKWGNHMFKVLKSVSNNGYTPCTRQHILKLQADFKQIKENKKNVAMAPQGLHECSL